MKRKMLANFLPAILVVCTLFTGWELYMQTTHINTDLLPSPSTVIITLWENWSILLPHIGQTLLETGIGIGIAIISGILTAILLDVSPWVRRALYPLLITSQTIPMIALAPLLLIWLGFDLLPKVIVVTLYCFFPIAIAMADGFANVDPELLNLFKSMNASYLQTMRFVKIPSAMPSFFSGLKIAVTYSMTGAIVGEYVGAYQGLGVFIQNSANSHELPLVFGAIFIIAIVSLLLFGLANLLEKLILPWQYKK